MTQYHLCSCGAKHLQRGQCADCKRRYERQRKRGQRQYTSEYSRAARAYLDGWVQERGEWCPGATDLSHSPHPAPRPTLSVDHIIPLSAGGSLMDTTNWRVLCKAVNNNTGRHRAQP